MALTLRCRSMLNKGALNCALLVRSKARLVAKKYLEKAPPDRTDLVSPPEICVYHNYGRRLSDCESAARARTTMKK